MLTFSNSMIPGFWGFFQIPWFFQVWNFFFFFQVSMIFPEAGNPAVRRSNETWKHFFLPGDLDLWPWSSKSTSVVQTIPMYCKPERCWHCEVDSYCHPGMTIMLNFIVVKFQGKTLNMHTEISRYTVLIDTIFALFNKNSMEHWMLL